MTPEQTRIFQSGSTTFYQSTRFFPRAIREKVFCLYAFVRVVDNFVDVIPQQTQAFYAFRDQWLVTRRTGYSKNLIMRDFLALEQSCHFPPEWIDAFFASMERDITTRTYQTAHELDGYTFGAAQVIGLCMAKIMGLPFNALDAAKDLGRAFQHINFIRDIAEDLSLGRTYLPQDHIAAFGLPSLQLSDTSKNPRAFTEFMHAELNTFHRYLAEARTGFGYLPRPVRIAIATAADMYEWTAAVIAKDPFVIYKKKVKPSKYRIALTGLKNTLWLPTPRLTKAV
jgi:15-cis-phytoene synthase